MYGLRFREPSRHVTRFQDWDLGYMSQGFVIRDQGSVCAAEVEHPKRILHVVDQGSGARCKIFVVEASDTHVHDQQEATVEQLCHHCCFHKYNPQIDHISQHVHLQDIWCKPKLFKPIKQ